MFTRNLCRVLLLALLSPAAALALGLGDIHLHSALNAPLDANIDLVGASAEDLAALKAGLASREAFKRSGLEYPGFLGTVTFTPGKGADGQNVIHLHSQDVVREPLATLLVVVDWARGHLVREYTILLDPPVFSSESPSSAPVAAPSAGASARSGSVARNAAVAPSAAAPSASAPSASASAPNAAPAAASGAAGTRGAAARSGTPGSYTVRRGDTLSAIANQAYPGGDRSAHERELVAIYRANAEAFDGNMNVLLAGSRLSLPGEAEVAAIGPGEALAEVRRQNAAWNGSHGASTAGGGAGRGQLRLVPPQEPAPASAASAASGSAAGAPSGASAAEAAALQQRVQKLESQLQESQRLLQMRSEELAALQARIAQSAGSPGHPAAAPAAPAAPAVPAVPPAAPAPAVVPAPASTAAAPSAPPVPANPPAAAPKPAPKAMVAPAPREAGNSFLDVIAEYWYIPAALLAVVIGLLVLRFVRSRQEDEFDRSLGRLQPAIEPTVSSAIRTGADTMPVRALPDSRGEQSYRVEESGSHEQPVFDEPREQVGTITTGQHVAIDDTVSSGQPVGLDQGDPLAEADFHMAYGLYDQAADLVQIAISRDPKRRDLKLKLLEVFFVWGNKDRFLQSARELAATRDQALAGEWDKIVIMGRQIAPEDVLFSNTGAVSGAASGGVDLNLEGGQNRVDFDLLGEPSVSAGAPDAGVDLDFGAALGDADSTGEASRLGDSGVDFVLDDPERGNDTTGSTREMPGAPGGTATAGGAGGGATVKIASGAAEADTPTVEQPHLHDGEHPTIRQKIDAASRAGLATSEQTAELAIDDLGLDLGTLESGADEASMPGGADAPTMLAGLDEDTRRLLARAEADRGDGGATATQRTPAGPVPTTTGTWLFTDTDFATVAPPGGKADSSGADADAATELVKQITPPVTTQIAPAPSFDSDSTSRLAALDSKELDLDFAELGAQQDVNGADLNLGGVDLDVGAASSGEGTFVQTQKIAPGELPLSELEPATMSEVGTKLDLARAYMDMGDPEGARSILSEVLSEGSVSQKQEARRLMDTLPG